MWAMLWPVLIVVASNTLYNITTKSVPRGINAYFLCTAAYLVAAVITFMLFIFQCGVSAFPAEVSKMNWTGIGLGLAIVGLEFGWIMVYRAGWKISMGSLVCNIALACVLFAVGVTFYKEAVSLRQTAGIIVCLVGLALISL